MNLSIHVKNLQQELKRIRRDLHQIPELGFQEFKTSEYIQKYLDELGLSFEKNVVGTGIIAFIKGSNPSKTYCFRADMDALEMQEENDLPFKSIHDGVMHGCGHDGHMAIILGLAKLLAINKNKLVDNIVLIFQPAEEGPGGALPMIESGLLKRYGVDEIYGLHLFPGLNEGRIGIRSGAMMSQNGEFDIIIQGKSAHGAMPHIGIDSIQIAGDMVLGIQSIISRSINPMEPAVITIGRIEAGEKRNIIAQRAILEGTIRTFSQETYDRIKERMLDFKRGLEYTYQCGITIDFRDMYPAVYNDETLTNIFINSQKDLDIEIVDPVMLAEDFAFFQKEVPGVFFFLGTRNENENFTYPLHSGRFNFNESVLGVGLQILVNLLEGQGAIKL